VVQAARDRNEVYGSCVPSPVSDPLHPDLNLARASSRSCNSELPSFQPPQTEQSLKWRYRSFSVQIISHFFPQVIHSLHTRLISGNWHQQEQLGGKLHSGGLRSTTVFLISRILIIHPP